MNWPGINGWCSSSLCCGLVSVQFPDYMTTEELKNIGDLIQEALHNAWIGVPLCCWCTCYWVACRSCNGQSTHSFPWQCWGCIRNSHYTSQSAIAGKQQGSRSIASPGSAAAWPISPFYSCCLYCPLTMYLTQLHHHYRVACHITCSIQYCRHVQ